MAKRAQRVKSQVITKSTTRKTILCFLFLFHYFTASGGMIGGIVTLVAVAVIVTIIIIIVLHRYVLYMTTSQIFYILYAMFLIFSLIYS